jgi:hypothetical protein
MRDAFRREAFQAMVGLLTLVDNAIRVGPLTQRSIQNPAVGGVHHELSTAPQPTFRVTVASLLWIAAAEDVPFLL